jgi:hypothetical protein
MAAEGQALASWLAGNTTIKKKPMCSTGLQSGNRVFNRRTISIKLKGFKGCGKSREPLEKQPPGLKALNLFAGAFPRV